MINDSENFRNSDGELYVFGNNRRRRGQLGRNNRRGHIIFDINHHGEYVVDLESQSSSDFDLNDPLLADQASNASRQTAAVLAHENQSVSQGSNGFRGNDLLRPNGRVRWVNLFRH